MLTTDSTTLPGPYTNPDGVVPEKRHWPTFFRSARTVLHTKDTTVPAYEAFLALLAPNNARAFYRLKVHPNGRRLLEHKPDIMAVLKDQDHLASLPPGTLGHAAWSFITTNEIPPGVYDDDVIRPIAERYNWSEDFYYLVRRGTALHDLLHAVTGYSADIAGETANLGFHAGQLEPAGAFLRWGWYLSVSYPGAPIRRKLRYFWEAVERGRRADNLLAAPWEELIDKPLDEVRELLGIMPTEVAHPNGHIYTTWAPYGNPPAPQWDYDAVVANS